MPDDVVSDELRNAALSRFQPLVFTLVTRHPQHVHLPSILEGLQREPALAGHFYTIDTRQLIRECVSGGKQGGARGRAAAPDAAGGNNNNNNGAVGNVSNNNTVSSSSMRRQNAQNDAARTAAAELREAYIRIAVAREVARREREAARVRAIDELCAQYVEDGFSEADARHAAERDWQESEAAAKDGSSDDTDDEGDEEATRGEVRWADTAKLRPERPVFVCILDYPNSLFELGELHRVGVPLSVVVELRSKIPLTGSELYLVDDAATATTHAGDRRVANKEDRSRTSVRRTRAADEGGGGGGGGALVAQLQTRSETRTVLDCSATDEVLLFTYEFGAALEQALASPGVSAATALLTMASGRPYGAQEAAMVQRLERSGRAALTRSLRQLARRWRHFCLWRQHRVLCGVPRCATIADVQRAVAAAQSALATDATGADKTAERGSARRTTLTPRRSMAAPAAASPGTTPTTPPLTPTPPIPPVAANVSERATATAGDGSREVSASPVLRAMAQLACDREAYAQYIDRCRQARQERQGGAEAGVVRCVRDFAWAALHAATATVAAPSPGVASAANPIDAMRRVRDAAELFCQQIFSDVVGPTACVNGGESTGAADDTPRLTSSGAVAGGAAGPAGAMMTGAAVTGDLRQAALTMWRRDGVTTTADADLEAAFAAALLSCGDTKADGRRAWVPQCWLLSYKNALGWRHEAGRWHDKYEVHLLHRPPGHVSRTQHTSYSFEGPTTFPEFVALLEYCERAWAHYHPPPPDSDASVTESESDDEDGSTSDDERAATTTAIPPPMPCIDHAARVGALLRRRRDYDAVKRLLTQPCLQEMRSNSSEGHAAAGARAAVEEVQWLFCADGVVIEAERTCGNTRQLACHVLPPYRGMECGFLFDDPITPSPPTGPVTRDVPCNIRSYCAIPHLLRLFVEVIADNSAAAEAAEYAVALEAARQEARAQFEALNVRSKSSRGRTEKGAAAAPTLPELEESCMAAVPAPRPRAPAPPSFQLVVLLDREDCVARLHLARAVLEVQPRVGLMHGSLAFELNLYVWRHGRVAQLCLTSYTHVFYHASGTVELFSRDAQGYRLLLGSRGGYMTEKHGTTLHVAADGTCTLRRGGSCTTLPPMQLAHRVDPITHDRLCEREDGVRLRWGWSATAGRRGEGSWVLSEVSFGNSVHLTRGLTKGRREWRVRGAPVVFCEVDETATPSRAFGLQSGPASLRVDLATRQAHLTCATLPNSRALLDARDYTLQVISADAQQDSVYTMDCAFGGLQADVHVAVDGGGELWRQHSYRVSPGGRCTEYCDGKLVLPDEYVATSARVPVWVPEVLSPAFVTALGGVVGMRSPSDVDDCHRRTVAQLREFRQSSRTTTCPVLAAPMTRLRDRREALAAVLVAVRDAKGSEVVFMPIHTLRALLAANGGGGGEGWDSEVSREGETLGETNEWHWVRAGGGVDAEVAVVAAATKTHEARSLTLPTPPPFAYYAKLAANTSVQGCGWWGYCKLNPTTPLTVGQITQWLALAPAADGGVGTTHGAEPATPQTSRAPDNTLKAESSAAQASPCPPEATPPPVDAPVTVCASNKVGEVGSEPTPPRLDERAWCYWRCVEAPMDVTVPQAAARSSGAEADTKQESEATTSLAPSKSAAAGHVIGAASATRHVVGNDGQLPLMHSTSMKPSQLLSVTSPNVVTRAAPPALSATPLSIDFGDLLPARCYGATIYLRNEGTAPCRYRVVVAAAVKPFIRVDYDHHFLAPGLTATATVHLCTLPACNVNETVLHVRHEGGTIAVALHWELRTVTTMYGVKRPIGVFCSGPCAIPFQPGTTRRWRPRQAATDEVTGENALEDDGQGQSSSSLASTSSPPYY